MSHVHLPSVLIHIGSRYGGYEICGLDSFVFPGCNLATDGWIADGRS